jgi:L-ascorbate metabolism protein UlaG (beta-lactamase superfamily)
MLENLLKGIQWLGHDAFSISHGGLVIGFDPYGVSAPPKADILLVTHEHFDHCSPEDAAKMQKPGTVIITEPMSAKKLTGDIRTMAPGDAIEVQGVRVEAVPAYNVNKPFHPRENNWLGFIVTLGGIRVYHAGDTDLIPEMADFKTDIALLPVSGTYVMTWGEAVEAARRIKPQVAIPMHYGAIVGSAEDAELFKKELADTCRVVVLS